MLGWAGSLASWAKRVGVGSWARLVWVQALGWQGSTGGAGLVQA